MSGREERRRVPARSADRKQRRRRETRRRTWREERKVERDLRRMNVVDVGGRGGLPTTGTAMIISNQVERFWIRFGICLTADENSSTI